jgi:hypothetical protein
MIIYTMGEKIYKKWVYSIYQAKKIINKLEMHKRLSTSIYGQKNDRTNKFCKCVNSMEFDDFTACNDDEFYSDGSQAEE